RSQNFLADPDVLEAILDLADPKPGDRILEIGPGLGILTGGLLDAGASVTAVEIDRGLAGYLRERFDGAIARTEPLDTTSAAAAGPVTADLPAGAAGRLTLIEADALDLDLTGLLPPPYKVVANLPYNITSPTLHRLLGGSPVADRIVLMLQAEVADRIAAPPGRMSYLSVFVQYHAEVRVVLRVPAEAFEPAPSVQSAVVVLEPRPAPDQAGDEDELWRLVQAGFRERRKMLRNVLGRQLPYDQARVDTALAAAGIAGDRRPQTLSVGEWLALRAALR
ncbi:MAG TPA: 16S rRNA (adenine(1518)-N(6)/adenine(1519)-N(6))-dimethyltransferase RsmA, partial [Candidatus Eisenbacteria bacterium]|nr:16S rRNA (adenine(1518)-N(6)/adenine(1519)-N(6))-dimethyltransferase RsmA [Candidatus Eisenbacteria bacterium]